MLEWLINYLNPLISCKFYGKIVISFENGKIVTVKEEKNIKLPVGIK